MLLAFFLGHFGYMQWKYNNIKEHISTINGEKKEVSTDIKQLNDTRTSVSAIENKLNYIKKVLPGKTKKIIRVFKIAFAKNSSGYDHQKFISNS